MRERVGDGGYIVILSPVSNSLSVGSWMQTILLANRVGLSMVIWPPDMAGCAVNTTFQNALFMAVSYRRSGYARRCAAFVEYTVFGGGFADWPFCSYVAMVIFAGSGWFSAGTLLYSEIARYVVAMLRRY